MLAIWIILTVLPAVTFGAGVCFCRRRMLDLCEVFFASRTAAAVLTAVAWFWTAWECSTIGIDVFDSILLKAHTNGAFVWALAMLLIYLTCIWMKPHLACRALMGVFMLIPAEALKATRPLVPADGFAPVQLLVVLLYVYAIIGMYGMFYPWRIENAVRRLLGGKPVPYVDPNKEAKK